MLSFRRMLEIQPDLTLPEDEVILTATRSGGPGGQNVNKVATRVELSFDVAGSPSLNEEQRQRLFARLPSRLGRRGVLRLYAQRERSQAANREAVIARFVALLRDALTPEKPRRPTRIPKREKGRRLAAKVHRSGIKRGRGTVAAEESDR